ncbi:S1C family serine protease [Patescibacteria group bacterium]
MKAKPILLSLSLILIIVTSLVGGALGDRIFGYKLLDKYFPQREAVLNEDASGEKIKIVSEESVVIDVVENVSPSVVTIGVKTVKKVADPFADFFDQFGFFGAPRPKISEKQENIEQDIGSGFIVSKDGMIATNKHVVADTEAEYKVITNDGQELKVEKIYRDPLIDLAILKVTPPLQGLRPIEMGDSSKLKVGQFVIAIGTALGEFRQTVTTGVISGLGRGITAGDPFGGFSEKLENVIQTDAAINPGNSGGPLLNSSGQVIGVNVATSQLAENIGFAIPINVVRESLDNFNKTGKFERPFLGVKYKVISKDLALLNEVPEGAYVVEIIPDSAASESGLEVGDIILTINRQKMNEDNSVIKVIQGKKVGDELEMEVWRDGETISLTAKLKISE